MKTSAVFTSTGSIRAVAAVSAAFLTPAVAHAGDAGPVTASGGLSSPGAMLLMLAALALVPFVIMMATSFVKISVVLAIVRNALGTQQIPPAAVITGLSVVLTMYVMAPVAHRMHAETTAAFAAQSRELSLGSVDDIFRAATAGKEPLREFLKRNTGGSESGMLLSTARERWGVDVPVSEGDFVVLIPAFVLTQLREGFRIGFCIYIPFLVIDLVLVNVLLALGMSMLPPATISVPLKLLVFIASDGWSLVAKGLVDSFRG